MAMAKGKRIKCCSTSSEYSPLHTDAYHEYVREELGGLALRRLDEIDDEILDRSINVVK